MPLAQQTLRALAKLAAWVADHKPPGSMVLGVSGAQGAGKSTLTALLATVLTEGFDLKVAGFSLDDLYLTRTERTHLAHTIHPLLGTRGVPGTHDVALGIRTLEALKGARPGDEILILVFDMECVFRWRLEQERKLAERYRSYPEPLRCMDEAELKRFIQHYERLTRWMPEEMPGRADVVMALNPNHRFDHIQVNTP